jgi:predicted NBD/HSP70 family sugar kinase
MFQADSMTSPTETGDGELIRAINRSHILDTVRRLEPISNQEICRRTGLSRSTVSMAVNGLLADGLLLNDMIDETTASTRGRPTRLFRLNPNAAFVVGIKLSMNEVSVVAANLRADTLACLTLPIRPWRFGPEIVVDLLEDGMRAVLKKAGLSLSQISGIGVGLPGFIDSAAGISYWNPILSAEKAPVEFARMLHDRVNVPVTLENDANLLALAERWFGHGQDVDNFAVILLESGIGMGLFLNGELYRGHNRMGTEFGHTKIEREGPLCRCSQRGCVEAFAADYAILREVRKVAGLPELNAGTTSDHTQICEAAERARNGDTRIKEIFENAGNALGVGIANFINVIDPKKIILAGAGMHAFDLIGPALMDGINRNTVSALSGRCEIIAHNWPDEAWVRGAAALILEDIYRRPRAVRTLT